MSTASTLERDMLALINQERNTRGLDPVQLELRLNDAAEDHSAWMLARDVFSHTGSGGSSARDRMEDAGFQFSGSWTWAENIAWQSERGSAGLGDDVENLHQSLMNSSGHRANILNPNVTVVGIGVERGNYDGWDAVMVTQVFARTSAPLQLDTGTSGSGTGATSGADDLRLSSAGTLAGLAGNDTLTGSAGDDKLSGGGGRDALAGARGADSLVGGGGADTLWGGAGDDRLYGGKGHDRINGGAGNDIMVGREGNDIFVFNTGDDVVRDFNAFSGAEDIDLRKASGIYGFNDLRANHMIQQGQHVLIEDAAGNSMLLRGVQITTLDADDFLF